MSALWIAVSLAALALSGCGESSKITSADIDYSEEKGSFKITIPIPKAVRENVSRVEYEVTGAGMELLRGEATIISLNGHDVIRLAIEAVEPGRARKVTLNAFDSGGEMTYSGSATADVLLGETVDLSIRMQSLAAEGGDESAVAIEVVGEIFPAVVSPGEETFFTCYLRPALGAGDTGFDTIELTLPFGRFGNVEGLLVDGSFVDFAMVELEQERAFIRLPFQLGARESGLLIEIAFSAAIYADGFPVLGRVSNSAAPELTVDITPGNATDEVESDRLRVDLLSDQPDVELLIIPDFNPDPLDRGSSRPFFSPNGDGVNDALVVGCEVYNVFTPSPLKIDILASSGSLVREVFSANAQAGAYLVFWDGMDSAGEVLPEGVYTVRASVEAGATSITEEKKVDLFR